MEHFILYTAILQTINTDPKKNKPFLFGKGLGIIIDFKFG